MTDDARGTASRREHADLLRAAHRPGTPLVLPNAWDAASARAVERAGFPVVATGSAAVAESLGFADGEQAPADEMLAAVARIVAAVGVPVTADVEAGYRMAPGELASRVAATGAAGVNIEDSVHPGGGLANVDGHTARLAGLRAADPDLVINARVDTFVRPPAEGDPADEAIRRARRYLDAGADCVYPIGAADERLIAHLVDAIPGPVNVLYRPGAPSPARLAELGVARISFGDGLFTRTQTLLADLLNTLHTGEPPY